MSQRNVDFGDDKDFGRTPDLNADAPGRRRGVRKRVCKFCADKAVVIDYKDPQALKYFISDRGKVVPRRISGNCARHQRKVTLAIKRARTIALLPFTATTVQVILQQDLKNLGKSGELVRVRPGYARNYLIPRYLAMPATVHNIKQLE